MGFSARLRHIAGNPTQIKKQAWGSADAYEAGVKQTVKWAIISIVASTFLSLLIGNWKDIYELILK